MNTIDLATVKPLARLGRNAIRHGLREGTGAILRAWGITAQWGQFTAEQNSVAYGAELGIRAAVKLERDATADITRLRDLAGENVVAFDFAMGDYRSAA